MAGDRRARRQLLALIVVLASVGVGTALYRHLHLGFPLAPSEHERHWTVEAKITFTARGGPAKVAMVLPGSGAGWQVVNANQVAPGYGFGHESRGRRDWGVWSKRRAEGEQAIFYQVEVSRTGEDPSPRPEEPPPVPETPVLDEDFRLAARALLSEVRPLSADPPTLAAALLRRLGAERSSPGASVPKLLVDRAGTPRRTARLAATLLALEGLPARVVRGVRLQDADGRRRPPVAYRLELFHDGAWVSFDPRTGDRGTPPDFFPWQRGGDALFEVYGGRNSEVDFSVLSEVRPADRLAVARGMSRGAALVGFSLYSLPTEYRNVFRLLLLVPVGALVVVIMRNLVGIRTAGTFMPVLIALSFLKTDLLPGLVIFHLVVSIGLVIRHYLSRLNLLLVPRISAVVIVVILLMGGLSVLSFKLEILAGLRVTFFPMVVLAWTIERMSILWEEDGAREVLIQGFGSLLVAVVSYAVMDNGVVRHLTFSFPELLLVVLAAVLLCGQYTGYRLSELHRFRHLTETR